MYRLKDISVRGPKMWAEDTGSGTQHQWMGWKYKIQRDTNNDGSYSTKFTSSTRQGKGDRSDAGQVLATDLDGIVEPGRRASTASR